MVTHKRMARFVKTMPPPATDGDSLGSLILLSLFNPPKERFVEWCGFRHRHSLGSHHPDPRAAAVLRRDLAGNDHGDVARACQESHGHTIGSLVERLGPSVPRSNSLFTR